MTKQELLAVLDMSEDEQREWVRDYAYEHTTEKIWQTYLAGTHSLEILAFRLRDEAGARFYTAMRVMYDEITNDSNPDGFSIWWMLNAKPIHWIIASLIAKGKTK